MKNETPLSRDELRKLRPSMRHMYILQKQHVTGSKKFAKWVTEKVGTMGFFYLMLFWAIGWVLWNVYAPAEMRFDEFPDFFFWIFLSSVISLCLLPIIMVGQNLQENRADARAEADFELNKVEEREIDTILHHLEYQNELIMKILDRLEGDVKEDIKLEKEDIAIDQEIKNEIKNVR